jgi:hypothetical protein
MYQPFLNRHSSIGSNGYRSGFQQELAGIPVIFLRKKIKRNRIYYISSGIYLVWNTIRSAPGAFSLGFLL